jgi:acetyl esterase/lipase
MPSYCSFRQRDSKVLVFIHGGYWQLFDKTRFHFIAAAFLPHHITTVVINYPLTPAAAMDEIVASCRKAVQWLQQNPLLIMQIHSRYILPVIVPAHILQPC